MNYRKRFYRHTVDSPRWKHFRAAVDTTDCLIKAPLDLHDEAVSAIKKYRAIVEDHIKERGEFLTSLDPLDGPPVVHPVLAAMYRASQKAQVGPMASVAGAIAMYTGLDLETRTDEIIIENGGDLWLSLRERAAVNIFSGGVYFEEGLTIEVNPEDTPCGICTSSGKLGHSISFGRADSVTVISKDAALADAAATGACNHVQDEQSLETAIKYLMSIDNISGAVIVYRDKMAAFGSVTFTEPEKKGRS